jgi:hypothetical protein
MTSHSTDDHLQVWEFDLTPDESRRRAAAMAAMGHSWDPVAAMATEDEAYRLLYSGLDEQQAALHRRLVEAGVLAPLEGDEHAAD